MECFTLIPDPRKEINRKYPLYVVIAIAIPAAMPFAQGWEGIERCGKAEQRRLPKFLGLKEGLPKHGACRRVFTALKPALIEACFMNWVGAIKQRAPGGQIATGGKALHAVSAWAAADWLDFGQAKAGEKSNEITAMPALLDKIALEGCMVSIGAAGCRQGVAGKTVKKKAGYLFSLKGNRGNLHGGVKEYFEGFD
jgi:hypothetical protein